MRIVRSESPSLPPLDSMLPSEDSWALQVEREEAANLHSKDSFVHRDHNRICRDNGKERIWGSSNWADCGSREGFHESRDAEMRSNPKMSRYSDCASYKTLDTRVTSSIERCDDSRRQARSIRQNTQRQGYAHRSYGAHGSSRSSDLLEADRKNDKKSSPPQSHRSHHCQYRTDLHETAMYTDTRMVNMADRSRHSSSWSDNAHSRLSHRARNGGVQAARFSEITVNAKHGKTLDVQLSETRDKGRHGDHRRAQDAESADNARHEHSSKSSDNGRQDCPRWHNNKVGRTSDHRRSKGNVGDKVKNECNQGVDKLKLEARSHFDNQKQRKYEGCIQAAGIQAGLCFKESNGVPTQSDDKCRDYKKVGNGDHAIDARNGTCQVSISQSEIKTRIASELYKEEGSLLMHKSFSKDTGDEECDTTSSQAGKSTCSTEGQRKGSSGSNSMLEMSSKDEVKEDNPSDTEKQYQMLASLLLDDSLDIDQDFDVMLAPGGLDLEYCGSIFDDDFELPVSMDVEAATHFKDAAPAKKEEALCASQPVDFQEPHVCAVPDLLLDEKNMMNHQSVPSNKLVEKHAVLSNSSCQPAEKQQSLQDSSKTKPSPRVFVDVTNKFEIHDAPVKRQTQENDTHRLNQRQRQVDFGKNTLGYERYSELVPRCKRKPQDPQTPNPKQVCSKRSWDGQIRKWRKLLHAYDLPNVDGEERAEDFSILKSRQGDATDSMRDNTRFSKSTENKCCNADKVKMMQEDANLTIYDDWIVF